MFNLVAYWSWISDRVKCDLAFPWKTQSPDLAAVSQHSLTSDLQVKLASSCWNGINLYLMISFNPRFFTGKNVWSAYLNITKCRVKSAPEEVRGRTGGRVSQVGNAVQNRREGDGEEENCPLRVSVAPRRPPDTLDPKTRWNNIFFLNERRFLLR